MKKSLYVVLFIGVLTSFIACSKNELQNLKGQVCEVQFRGDTLFAMTLTSSSSDDTLVFKLDKARYNNGVALKGDSVIVDYIEGKNDTLRALVVTIIGKHSHLIEPSKMTNDSLVTRPYPVVVTNDSVE